MNMPSGYTFAGLQAKGPIGWWTEFALHRGQLCDKTQVLDSGTEKQREVTTWYFHLGLPGLVGVADGRTRMVLETGRLRLEDWQDALDGPGEALQGPWISPLSGGQSAEFLKARARDVMRTLREGPPAERLKFKLRDQPKPPPFRIKGRIDYEDRPDVGRVVKPAFRLRGSVA